MTISNQLFGLVQCYSEQGICYYKDFGFNPGFLIIFYVGIIILITSLIFLGIGYYLQNKQSSLLNKPITQKGRSR